MVKGLKNVDIYVEDIGVIKGNIAFENGIIKSLNCGDFEEIANFSNNAVVVPGFIDEHIHGSNFCDSMDADFKSLKNMASSLASEGTTSFLATTMTQSKENILSSLSNINNYIKKNEVGGAEIIGVHLEGPFISSLAVGAQSSEYVLNPSVELFNEFNKASGGNVKIVSLAPEIDGAIELIKYLKENKVVASIAHTNATYNDCQKAVENGATCVTHTYNAQSGLHHRDVGVVGTALLNDDLFTELICDIIHVSVPAIKILLKNKPKDKVVLITDSMRAKYMPNGEYELGGQSVVVKGDEARLKNGALAGSVLKMNVAIKNLVEKVGVSFTDAIDFATKNPAINLGVFDKIGSIKVGKRADFTVLDKKTYEVLLTVRNGNVIYKKQ